jgi:hypothetical protein
MERSIERALAWSAGPFRCMITLDADDRFAVTLTENEKPRVTMRSHSLEDAIERAAELQGIYLNSDPVKNR